MLFAIFLLLNERKIQDVFFFKLISNIIIIVPIYLNRKYIYIYIYICIHISCSVSLYKCDISNYGSVLF